MATPDIPDTARSIELDRMFDGPVDLIYRVWTDPRMVALWWGIENATNPRCELDVRPGGRWRIDMRTVSGKLYRNEGVYLDVVPDRRLVYSDVPDPELTEWQGQPAGERIHTVTFEDRGDRTRVKLHILFETVADRERMVAFGMPGGLSQGLERLAALLATLAAQDRSPDPDPPEASA